MTCKTLEPAKKIGEAIMAISSKKLPLEIILIDDQIASIVVDVDGIDYILTVNEVPKQRTRPTEQ